MKFTLSWLKDYLDTNASLTQICETLTNIGLEVESVDNRSQFSPFIIAQIVEASRHPQADKLQVCKVDTGNGIIQVVCGAPNARKDLKVVLAPVGTLIPGNGLVIKASSIRSVESNGMLCSASELGLGEDSDGIIEIKQEAVVGSNFAVYQGLDDPIIEVAITPNRGDCLGVFGIARDLAAAGLGQLKPEASQVEKYQSKNSLVSPIKVKLNNPECSYFVGRYFKNLTNKPSPDWMQQRLTAIGLKPISALVDITNYMTYSFNRPLHAYDVKKLSGDLEVRLSQDKEGFRTLQHKDCVLPAGITVIADKDQIHAVAGIIGAENSGCEIDTKEIFLEVAYFDPAHVAVSGRKLAINTDSRYRFERNVDPAFMLNAAEIATKMIIDICGGEASELVMVGAAETRAKTINFNIDKVYNLGGMRVEEGKIKEILEALGFAITGSSRNWQVKVPSWRPDIEGEPDLVEEITRINGYENLEISLLPGIAENKKATATAVQNRRWLARRLLASRGLTEVVTWSFMPSTKAVNFHALTEGLHLVNPISSELNYMRQTIIPNLLDALLQNSNRGYNDLALFECGPIFSAQEIGKQEIVLAGIRSGNQLSQTPHQSARKVDLYDAKADIYSVLEALNIPLANIRIAPQAPNWYHPGRSGTLQLGKAILGYFGELHPGIVAKYDLPVKAVAFELLFDGLPASKVKNTRTKPTLILSDFQKVVRDFAFIVDETITVEQLLKTVRLADKLLITDVQIFDIYRGKGIDSGKKSVALTVTFTPTDKTLTDSEIQNLSQIIIDSVTKQCAATLRG